MPDGSCERRILDAVRALVREIRLSSAAAERAGGSSAARLFVLRTLAAEPGLGIAGLAARTRTDPSSVSVVVARLADAGLVERRRDPGDARRTVLAPTARGRRLAGRADDPVQLRLIAGLAALAPAARGRLARDLGAWIAAMGIDASAPEMFFEPKRAGARRRRP